jgi:hypothetical protein
MRYLLAFLLTLALMPVLAPAASAIGDAYQTAKGTSTRDPMPSEIHKRRTV